MSSLPELIKSTEFRLGIPDGLLYACAMVESRMNPNASRYESHLNDYSLGLLQILTRTARDTSWLRPMGLAPIKTRDELLDPATNLEYGGAYLKYQFERFPEIKSGKNWPEERWRCAVASYNGGRGNTNLALAAARRAIGVSINDPGEYPWREFWFWSGFLGVATEQSAQSAMGNKYHVTKVWAEWWKYKRERGCVRV